MLEKPVADGSLAESLGPAFDGKNLGFNFKQPKNWSDPWNKVLLTSLRIVPTTAPHMKYLVTKEAFKI